ncbi:serine hydrolase [Blastococcus sp. TF02A-30]|uniref:serine hydrolase n=1 Tax=Blastococcus sp. TF02A-30 TaxID=2250580 RepID=UPI000DEB5AEC|nr:serine hydrolase [Blastococcus sp. TF02A-30]RBY87617.1 LppW family protein [Blastococcus sp. TF02A-30]
MLPVTAGRRAVVRLLVSLLTVLLAETLQLGPRRPGDDGLRHPGPEAAAAQVAAAARAGVPGGTTAVATASTDEGVVRLALSPDGDRPFPTASLVKLFVAEDVLHRARVAGVPVPPEDSALLADMVRRSDDAAASRLWVRHGGGRMVSDVADRYGLTGTAPPAVPGRWGQSTTTARDVAVFLARLPAVAHPDDAASLLGWLRGTTATAADGFDQRYGVLAAPGPAAKQGWMCCVDGRRHLHSAGVREGEVVVLLSELPAGTGWAAARAGLDAVAAALPAPPDPRC